MAALLERKGRHNVEQSSLGQLNARQFCFADFFQGHTKASGWFSDRFGAPRRHFSGDFFGYHADNFFILDEKLYYTDGVFETRQWKVHVSDAGIFTAESDSLIDRAHGFIDGNKLSMAYSMKVKIEEGKIWELDMKDVMILQPDGSLHNITQVYKWGVRIGTVSTQYSHHSGEKCVAESFSTGSTSTDHPLAQRHLSSVGS